MRTKPSPKHAKKMYKMLMKELGGGDLNLEHPYLRVFMQAARKAFNVKIHIVPMIDASNSLGQITYEDRLIKLSNNNVSPLTKIATLCHELVHMYSWDNKIFNSYSNGKVKYSGGDFNGVELWVENVAEELFNYVFPHAEFYRTIHEKDLK